MQELEEILKNINLKCETKGWDKDWVKGGCYIHLEVSEFIESLRGKGNDPPEKEAADVLFTLLAVMGHYNLSIEKTINYLKEMACTK